MLFRLSTFHKKPHSYNCAVLETGLNQPCFFNCRYSAARRQFGPEEGGKELAVIEYQTQQCRLFPYLAASYALHHFANSLGQDMIQFNLAKMAKEGY